MSWPAALRREAGRRGRRRHLPVLEWLDDRTLLSTFTVADLSGDPTDTKSLPYAVGQANSAPGSTILFQSGLTGTITLAATLELQANVTITGPGASSLTVSRGATSPGFSVFTVDTDVTASISGLTIAGGNAGSGSGGGIDNSGTLTVSGSTFTGNSAFFGGGGIFNSGTATVSGSTFTSNSAIDGDGGGIYNGGTATVTVSDSTFTGNSAFFGGGGGIDNYGTATVSDSTFTGNGAVYGGGIDNYGTATVSGSTFTSNSAIDGDGGGIYNGGTATVSGSTFTSNSAVYNSGTTHPTGDGGGIYNSGTATATVSGSTFTRNSAHEAGGGIDNSGTATVSGSTFTSNSALYSGGGGVYNNGPMRLTNCTISNDSAAYGGGVYGAQDTAKLYNTIVAHCPVGGDLGGGNIQNGIFEGGYNLIDDSATAGGLTNGANGNLVGVDPLLGLLGSYGGPTQTLPLLPGSPAIDAGNAALAVDAQGKPLTTDQRGMPRVVGAAVDIGAFESSGFTLAVSSGNNQATGINTAFLNPLQVTVTPKNPGDPVDGGVVTFTVPGSGASATLSSSGPVTITSGTASVTATANGIAGGPYAVTVATTEASPVSFSLTNTESLSLVVSTLADSPTPGLTTLRQALANAATLGGSQTVSFAAGLTGSIALSSGLEISSNVTIAGLGAALLTVSGGGTSSDFSVFTVDSGVTATISGLTIAGGHRSGSNVGGGVSNSGTLTLAGDVLSGNSAGFGGGLLNAGTAVLVACTLSSNSATNSGGGVYSGDGSTLTLINDTITGDSASYGGGVFDTGAATLTNVTVAADPTNSGGALDNYGAGTVTLNNTIVANRTSGGDIAGTVSGSSNLIDDSATAGGLTNGANGNLVGVDPLLGLLGSYGGPTQTLPLLPGSPAIDAGNAAVAVDAQGKPLTTDQRGMARVVGAAVDIGAFESSGFTLAVSAGENQSTGVNTAFPKPPQVTVTPKNPGDPVDGGVVTFTVPGSGASATLSPSGPVTIASGTASVTATANGIAGGPYAVTVATAGASPVSFFLTNTESLSLVVSTLADSPTPGLTTLRQTLANAATLGGSQTISFAAGLTGSIALSSGLEISSNVTIAGPGAALLTVSGGGAASDFSVFTVDSGVTATISRLTIAGGNR